MLDLKLSKMMVVNILETRDTMTTNVACSDQTDRMVQVRTSFPSKGESLKNKIPAIPLKTKIGPAVCRKTDMVVTTFIVTSGLIALLVYVTREGSNEIQGEREILDPKI